MQLTGQKPSEFDTATKNSLKAALGIASNPNVKRYKALLEPSFSGNMQDGLVAHALNADDPDYLGDLTFEYDSANAKYIIHGYEFYNSDVFVFDWNQNFIFSNVNNFFDQNGVEHNVEFVTGGVYAELRIFNGNNPTPFNLIKPFIVDFTVIEQSNSITLFSAVIPIGRDRLTLTFDKPISPFNIQVAIDESIFGLLVGNSFLAFEVYDNCLDLIFSPTFRETYDFQEPIPLFRYSPQLYHDHRFFIESRDFGILPPISEFLVSLEMSE